jgi:NHL repeat-containing protein
VGIKRGGGVEPGGRLAIELGLALLGVCFALAVAPQSDFGVSEAFAAPPILWNQCDAAQPAGERCNLPRGIAADPRNGHVFVNDQINSRVIEYDALGNFLRTWGWDVVESGPDNAGTGFEICVPENGDQCKAGVSGAGVGQFSNSAASGLAVNSDGEIFVTDWANHRIQKFDSAGNFVLMIGGHVNETSGGNVCPRPGFPGDVCRTTSAVEGGGEPGEFGPWAVGDFITTDGADNVDVGDHERIQRFDGSGAFEDQCTVPGTVQSLTSDSAGRLYAIYQNQLGVRKLNYLAGGECEEIQRFEIPKLGILGEVEPTPMAVAVDSANHVYAFCCPNRTSGSPTPVNPIVEFDQGGNIIDEFGREEFEASTGMATNFCAGSKAPGNLYVSNSVNGVGPPSSKESFIRAYGSEPTGCFRALTLTPDPIEETSATLRGTVNPSGALSEECRFEWGLTTAYGNIAPCVETPAQIGEGSEPVSVHADIGPLEGGTVYHVRLKAKIDGETETGPDVAFKTLGPPAISAEHVASTTDSEATLKALVSPEGFPTSCRVDYGPTSSYGQSTTTVGVGSDRSEHPVVFVLEGLSAGSTYHWRFRCANTAVKDGGLSEGADRTLNTYRSPTGSAACPNDAFRGGASAFLPDCRAYEMVSPVDKNGADIFVAKTAGEKDPGGYIQATPDGARITYTASFPTFGEDAPNSSVFNQYLASRGEGGWSSEGIHQPYLGQRIKASVPGAFREFIAFTPDLCSAWVADFQTPALEPDGQDEAANLLRREDCGAGAGSFETLTTSPLGLVGEARSHYVDQFSVQGISDDGSQAVFVANAPLTPDADPGTEAQLYDRVGGGLKLVSVLPGGAANGSGSAVGSGRDFNQKNALSGDGSRLYWTAGVVGGKGKLYLRLHPDQGIVANECNKAGTKACTLAVSAGSGAFFWAASPDGGEALYSEGEKLYRYDLASRESTLVAEGVAGVAGNSEDLSRIYLVSREALVGSGQNSQGGKAQEGEPNLYLAEAGSFRFVATLAEGDVGAKESGAPIVAYEIGSLIPYRRATRVSADGRQIAFESRAPLTSFDNADEQSGVPAVEVYRYEAGGELECVSCNPSGARPATREMTEPYAHHASSLETKVRAAAFIPTWEHPLNASNALSADGSRLFFDSNDALLPRDTNGAQDVYEWEAAGTGGCETGSADFFPQNGGCIYLISSGENPFESEFWEATPDGRDVFFATEASLLPQDPGSIDLYDARAGGGFPPAKRASECEGEACQSPPPPPQFGQPSSSSYNGLPNPVPAKRRRCPKGRHLARRKGRARCVKKARRHRHHHQNTHGRRAGR